MRLSLSNLALASDVSPEFLGRLATLGLSGIEVAPTRLAPWDELTPEVINEYRQRLSDSGLSVSSLQALLFGTENLNLLRDEASFQAMLDHLTRVAEIGALLGARVGVFGSPRNRLRGDLEPEAAWELGRTRFRRLAEAVGAFGFSLGLEPVPAAYGGDFAASAADIIRMVDEVDHPGLCVHLDTGCVMLGGDDIVEAIALAGPKLSHFHIAEPKLAPLRPSAIDHAAAATALHAQGYDGWIAIEMLEVPDKGEAEALYAVEFAAKTYLK